MTDLLERQKIIRRYEGLGTVKALAPIWPSKSLPSQEILLQCNLDTPFIKVGSVFPYPELRCDLCLLWPIEDRRKVTTHHTLPLSWKLTLAVFGYKQCHCPQAAILWGRPKSSMEGQALRLLEAGCAASPQLLLPLSDCNCMRLQPAMPSRKLPKSLTHRNNEG